MERGHLGDLTGAFLWTQAVGRIMLAQGKTGRENPGSIVNISSDAGRAGSIGQINYAAAKSGLLGMTMSTAKEWSKFGVRTNSVCFGVVETPMTETIRGDKFRDGVLARIPMGRWAAPDEAVKPVCFLLSDAASYITGSILLWTAGITSPFDQLPRSFQKYSLGVPDAASAHCRGKYAVTPTASCSLRPKICA